MNLSAWHLYFTGFADPDPHGAMAFGWAVVPMSTGELFSDGGLIRPAPTNTSELAAYCGLFRGLERLAELRKGAEKYPGVRIRTDVRNIIQCLHMLPMVGNTMPERERNAHGKCRAMLAGIEPVELEVVAKEINGLAWLKADEAWGKRKAG